MKWLSTFFRRSPPQISQEQAIAIAQEVCRERGWPWRLPVDIKLRRNSWHIFTNTKGRGANITVEIDCASGAVKKNDLLAKVNLAVHDHFG